MPGDNSVVALTQGVDDTETLYAAQNFDIYKTSDVITGSPPTWVNVNYNLPSSNLKRITSVAVDPNDADRVWVTLGGYVSGEKVYVLHPDDTVWTNFSEDLPNVPVHKIVYQAGGLYVGTEIGIFYTNSNVSGWIPYMNGLPAVPVYDMVIEDGFIFAGTFGRGLWKSTLFSVCPLAYALTPTGDPSNPNSTGVQRYEATLSISSTRHIVGGIGTDVIYRAGNFVRLDPGFEVKTQNEFEAKIGGCSQQ
ncbi:MAG: hypothetical protein DRI69_02345 [Bacteroidetes bacterium]|nr:MAG: hypothetical protein DRI69_02345 [Bacteroidota bacterium]